MKSLCDLGKKDVEKHAKKMKKSLNQPVYFCAKCARISDVKKQLCTPETINIK